MLPALLSVAALAAAGPGRSDLDAAFARYWAAEGPAGRALAAEEIVATGAGFDEVFARLRAGRPYSADVPRGRVIASREAGGVRFPYMLWVPEGYDPARRHAVRFDLHGGMGQPEWKELDGSWSPGWAAIEEYGTDRITVLPAGWWDAMWWEASQVDNFAALLDLVKRTYNVDENRVVFVGGSDGGVAAWFYAMRHADPWASYVATVSHPARLTSTALRADGQLHPTNLDGQTIFAVNGDRDRIISVSVMRKYVELFRERTAVDLDYRERAGVGHELVLDDVEADVARLVELLQESRRDPLPDRVSWATERTDRYNRRAWLVIDELAPGREPDLEGILPRFYGPNVPRTKPPKPKPWGRVRLEREGNLVRAETVGVKRFTLLLAPGEFDLTQPVRVVVDGGRTVERTLAPDVRTLLRWAARDDDRTALFAAELSVDVE